MHLHVDGARLANAAAALDASLAELTTEAGVDVVSFGGTKNGLVFGEAVVFCRPELAESFAFTRKQLGQLASKMRFVSAQFEALLERRPVAAKRPRTRTRWRRGWPRRSRRSTASRSPTRSRPTPSSPASTGRRSTACCASLPGEHPFYVWDEAERRGALDVRLGHGRGRRRRFAAAVAAATG